MKFGRNGRHGALILASLLVAAPVQGAFAQGFPSTQGMSCTQVQGLVQSSNSVVLDTGANTFNRFVKDVAYCQPGEVAKPTWVPTRDVPQCSVAVCWDPSTDEGGR